MLRRVITEDIAEFMVEVVEVASAEFYGGDKALTFKDLNDRGIWQHFVLKYEEKRNLRPEQFTLEISQMLGKDERALSNIGRLNEADTDFVKKILRELSKKYDWNYSVTFEKFYTSNVCKILSGTNVGLSVFSLEEIFDLFSKEFTE